MHDDTAPVLAILSLIISIGIISWFISTYIFLKKTQKYLHMQIRMMSKLLEHHGYKMDLNKMIKEAGKSY